MSDESKVLCESKVGWGEPEDMAGGPEQCERQRTRWGIRHRRKGGNSILPTSIYLVRARPLDGVGRIKMEI